MSRSGDILKAIIAPFGKTLWTGAWSSGSITVNGISKYSILLITLTNNNQCIGISNGSTCRFMAVSGSANQYVFSGSFTISGDTCTWGAAGSMQHNGGGNHGAFQTLNILSITGLVPNWGEGTT